MASISVTPRSFPSGETVISRNIPGNVRFSTLTLIVDISQWTSPTTSHLDIFIEFSADGGATWNLLASSGGTDYNGPDWLNPRGVSDPRIIMTRVWEDLTTNGRVAKLRDITTARVRVVVTGAPLTLGATITVQ